MNSQRREFLKLSSTIAAGMLLIPSCRSQVLAKSDIAIDGLKTLGLQLYTLRDDMPKDPKGILKQVANFGYKQIESYNGPQGIFWGMSNIDFKKYMDELDMRIVSAHCDINKNFEQQAAEAAAIGMRYLICPWIGPQKTLDDYKNFADTFNKKGEVCRQNGIRFAYHNHAYSFKKTEGQIPQELLMNNTDAELVDFEMDMYWVAAASEDIEAWLRKYKNRFRLCHIKDRSKTPVTDEGLNSVVVGTGSIDWKKTLPIAEKNGMQYYIIEQEAYKGTTPLKAVETGASYIKNLFGN